MGSLILSCADATRVEAGGALAVDRYGFARLVTERVRSHPRITVREGEVTALPPRAPWWWPPAPDLRRPGGRAGAAAGGGQCPAFLRRGGAPGQRRERGHGLAWMGSRYDKGTDDYVNCPMNREEYDAFWQALTTAQQAEVHGFEDSRVFEGCMPVEVMARRGHDTLLLRPAEVPGPGRSPHRPLALRGGAAPPGQRRRHGIQSGGLSDPSALSGAAAGLFHDPGAAPGGVSALRRDAPQYVPGFAPAAQPVLPTAKSGTPASPSPGR
jgi:methylenetetrahydrofolate--tRNA-(uracil-5-)-methyltransferase